MVKTIAKNEFGLSPDEVILAEDVLRGLWNKVGKDKAITVAVMVKACKKNLPAISKGLNGQRMSVIIHYLRFTGRLSDLVASKAGYYREPTVGGLERYKASLMKRAEAILEIVRSIKPVGE